MKNNALLIITTALFLSSCGGSESNSTPSPTTTINNNILPQTLNNTHLEITLNNPIDTSAQNDLPQIEETLTHYFGNGDVVYLQAAQDNDWQYRGTFLYERLNDDNAKITVALSDSTREYSLDCVFTDTSSGTCNAAIEQGMEISGEFTLSANIASQDHDFIGTVEDEQTFSSSITGITYPYRVYLPVGYHESNKSYPILYATDGQWEFWRFSYVIETSNKEIILVAIEQGPDQRRVIDYALEGSHNYLNFLETEMLPLIESTYRVDTSNRTLEGASWGGLLVRHALSREVTIPLFKNFISIDGSYGNFTQPPFINDNSLYQSMEDTAFPTGAVLNANIYLSGATIAGNGNLVENFKTELQNRNIKELTIYHQSFNVRHEEAGRPSIKDALLKLFP